MAVYYVNEGTGSDSNTPAQAQSSSTPWKTLLYAMQQLQAGDTLLLDGTTNFTGWTTNILAGNTNYDSGSALNPIIVQLNTGATAQVNGISGRFNKDYWRWRDVIFDECDKWFSGDEFGAANYGLRWNDCTFQHTPASVSSQMGQIVLLNVDDVIIDGCTFDNLRSRQLGWDYMAIRLWDCNAVTISNNTATDIGADFVHIAEKVTAAPDNPDPYTVTNITIEDNDISIIRPYVERDENGDEVTPTYEFSGIGEGGIDIKSGPGPIYIQGNTFSGYRKSNGATQDMLGNGFGGAIVLHLSLESGNYYISRNKVTDCERALTFANYRSQGNKGIEVYNNIFEIDAAVGDAYGGTTTYTIWQVGADDTVFENNTLRCLTSINHHFLYLDATGLTFRNNIIYSSAADGDDSIDPSQWTITGTATAVDYNCWHSTNDNANFRLNLPAAWKGSNDITTDPTLDANYIPDSAWAGVNGGINTGYGNDYYSNPRPGAGTSAYDIGAVEYQDNSTAPVVGGQFSYSLRRKIGV